MDNKFSIDKILNPEKIFSKNEIFSRPSPIPKESGVYGAYFKEVPSGIDIKNCVLFEERTLLYIGVSTINLQKRIKGHYTKDASRSTLRNTLGILLADKSKFPLRRIEPYKRKTRNFTPDGESWLNLWVEENMFFSFETTPSYLQREDEYLKKLGPSGSLPLNIDKNTHPYSSKLKRKRKAAVSYADKNVFYKT